MQSSSEGQIKIENQEPDPAEELVDILRSEVVKQAYRLLTARRKLKEPKDNTPTNLEDELAEILAPVKYFSGLLVIKWIDGRKRKVSRPEKELGMMTFICDGENYLVKAPKKMLMGTIYSIITNTLGIDLSKKIYVMKRENSSSVVDLDATFEDIITEVV